MKGRILAIDYGRKKIGIAISDETQSFASVSKTIKLSDLSNTMNEISKICAENNIFRIIIGIPKRMNGNEGEMAEEVRNFAAKIQAKMKCDVVLWDERLTSAEAERLLVSFDVNRRKRKEIIDQIAAKIILQTYLSFINT